MTSGRSNAEYADDIRGAARILTRVTRLGRRAFMASSILRAAAERQIGIIGEAAHEIEQNLRGTTAADPGFRTILEQAYAMRSKLAHAYERTNPALVWEAVKTSTPALLDHLDRHFPLSQQRPADTVPAAVSPAPPGTRRNRKLCGATTSAGGICSHPAPRLKRTCPAGHPKRRSQS